MLCCPLLEEASVQNSFFVERLIFQKLTNALDKYLKNLYSIRILSQKVDIEIFVFLSSSDFIEFRPDIRVHPLRFSQNKNFVDGSYRSINWRHIQPLTKQKIFSARNCRFKIAGG